MKIRFSLVALLLGTLAALSLKIYQIYDRTIDLTTCFTKEGSVIAIMLPVVIIAAIAAMMVVAFISPEYPKFSPNHRSVPLGFVCIAISFVLSYTMSMDFVKTEGREFGGTAGMICSILGLLSVVSFFFLAIGFFRADNMIESTPLVLIFPVSWMGLRLTLSFFNATSAANITENSYDILAMAFMLVFLLTVGKFMSGAAELSAKWAFAVGCPASMLAFLSTVPRYFIKYMTKQQPEYYGNIAIDKSFEPHLVDLLLAVFAFMFLFHISKRTVTKSELEHASGDYNKSMAAKFGTAAGAGAAFGTTAYGSNAYDANKYGIAARQPQMRDPNAAKASQFAALRARAGQAPQRAMYGSGADQYTTKGAGMKVADSFSLRSAYSKGSNQRYGGLGDFRNQMTGGRRAMDVLETSNSKKNIGFKPLNIDIGSTPEEEEAARKAAEEQKKELGDLNGVVATSLAGLFGAVKGEPKEVSMEASPDEDSSVTDNLPEIEAGEADEMAKAVVLGTGLADKLAEKKEPSVKYGRRATDSIDPDAPVKYGRRATDSINPDDPSMSMYGRRATDVPMYDDVPPYGRRADDGYGVLYEDETYNGRYGGRGYDDYDQGEYDYQYADEAEDYDEYEGEDYDEYEDEEYDGYDDENYYDGDEDEYYDDDEYDEEYDEDEYYDEDDEDYYDE